MIVKFEGGFTKDLVEAVVATCNYMKQQYNVKTFQPLEEYQIAIEDEENIIDSIYHLMVIVTNHTPAKIKKNIHISIINGYRDEGILFDYYAGDITCNCDQRLYEMFKDASSIVVRRGSIKASDKVYLEVGVEDVAKSKEAARVLVERIAGEYIESLVNEVIDNPDTPEGEEARQMLLHTDTLIPFLYRLIIINGEKELRFTGKEYITRLIWELLSKFDLSEITNA